MNLLMMRLYADEINGAQMERELKDVMGELGAIVAAGGAKGDAAGAARDRVAALLSEQVPAKTLP